MGFEPTTLRDLVGCSNHLSYWRLYGEQGPICGSRLEPHHAATQPSNDRHTRSENSLTASLLQMKILLCSRTYLYESAKEITQTSVQDN